MDYIAEEIFKDKTPDSKALLLHTDSSAKAARLYANTRFSAGNLSFP